MYRNAYRTVLSASECTNWLAILAQVLVMSWAREYIDVLQSDANHISSGLTANNNLPIQVAFCHLEVVSVPLYLGVLNALPTFSTRCQHRRTLGTLCSTLFFFIFLCVTKAAWFFV